MSSFKNYSIRTKLILLLSLSAMIALLISSAATLANTLIIEKKSTIKELHKLATISSENIKAALAFNDEISAKNMLRPLQTDETFMGGFIHDKEGKLFLAYISQNNEQAKSKQFINRDKPISNSLESINWKYVKVTVPISLDNEPLGTLTLIASTSKLKAKIIDQSIIQIIILVITLIVIILLSIRLQRLFTKPIFDLISVMNYVSEKKDYSTAAKLEQDDEFKRLYSGFNSMIKEIKERDDTLEETVNLRTKELQQTVKELKISNRIKSEFLATMSHELRTPMNGVIGMADLLTTTMLNQRQTHLVSTIVRSGESLITIINDILDFSKIDAGKMSLTLEALSLKMVSMEVCSSLEELPREKDVKLFCNIASNLPPSINADYIRLKQILTNLLGNAIKFTHHGSISFNVQPTFEDTNSVKVLFEIIDTGIGIEKNKQEKIFELFSQADSSTTRQFGGTGLGLAIASNLVRIMGSQIKVESEVGKGSRFFFEVTFVKNDSSESLNKSSNTPSASLKLFKGTALVADDEPVNLEVGQDMLEQLGFHVNTAINGEEAYQVAIKNHYDIIFMDIQMPGTDGMMATQKIRSFDDESISNVPIIALTANALKGDKERFIEAGLSDYLSKPYTLKKLSHKLEEWLTPIGNLTVGKEESFEEETTVYSSLDSVVFSNLLKRYTGDRIPKLIHLISLFFDSAEKHRNAILEHYDNRDCDALSQTTHALKSASANIGAIRLSHICKVIEKDSKMHNCDKVSERISELIFELEHSEKELKEAMKILQEKSSPQNTSTTPNGVDTYLAQINNSEIEIKEVLTQLTPFKDTKITHVSDAKNLKILVIDDDLVALEVMRDQLEERNYTTHTASSGIEALKNIEQINPDLILLDVEMPDMDGYTTCEKLRELPISKNTPIIMVTGHDDLEAIENAFKVGATDFETKPINWSVFSHRMHYIFQASNAFIEVNKLATTDVLTSLPNRRHTFERMEQMLQHAKRESTHFSCIMIDIDYFKKVNDTLGHPAGDVVLKDVARVLDATAREYDVVGRIGGEEFLVLCENTNKDLALIISERLRKAVEELIITYAPNDTTQVTISLGLFSDAIHSFDMETILKLTDDALYNAKESGRNCVSVSKRDL